MIVEDGRLRADGQHSASSDDWPIGETVPLDRSTVMGRSICDKQTGSRAPMR